LNSDAWKKKLEETFADDPEARCMAIVESLRSDSSKLSNIIERKSGSAVTWKESAL
jgi:hypothetical protein